jgi:hypothetical protein
MEASLYNHYTLEIVVRRNFQLKTNITVAIELFMKTPATYLLRILKWGFLVYHLQEMLNTSGVDTAA